MLEVVNENFFGCMAAGLGIFSVPTLVRKTTSQAELDAILADLNDWHNGPTFYCSTNDPAQFFNRAVMWQGHTWASHNGLFVPAEWGKEIRHKHPELLTTRRLVGTTTEAGILHAVPKDVFEEGEVLDSQVRFAIQDVRDVTKPGEFVVFFKRQWTDVQAEAIIFSAYWYYGAPYDVFEIGSYVSGLIPNLSQIRVCSTMVEWISEGRDPRLEDNDPKNFPRGDIEIRPWMKQHGIDPDKCAPGHNGTYWFTSPKFTPVAIHCDVADARQKI